MREAEGRVAAAQKEVDAAHASLAALLAQAAAAQKEVAAEEAEKIRKAEDDLTLDGLTAAEQRKKARACWLSPLAKKMGKCIQRWPCRVFARL